MARKKTSKVVESVPEIKNPVIAPVKTEAPEIPVKVVDSVPEIKKPVEVVEVVKTVPPSILDHIRKRNMGF